jgi:hypothetical protein
VAGEKRFLLRLDPRVWRAIRRWSEDDLRSVNGQIEFLLRRALRESGRLRDGARESGEGDGPPPG